MILKLEAARGRRMFGKYPAAATLADPFRFFVRDRLEVADGILGCAGDEDFASGLEKFLDTRPIIADNRHSAGCRFE